MTPADLAKAAALAFECKKDSMRQNQDGTWKITFTVQSMDVPRSLTEAMPGTRYQAVIVAIGDDEMPVKLESEVMPIDPEPNPRTDARPGQEIPRPDRAKRSWRELHPAQQAGMRCNEPLFQAFLEQEKRNAWTDGASILGGDTNRYEQAVRCVRALCSVSSRADLNKDPDAADIWRRLDDQYEAWKLT